MEINNNRGGNNPGISFKIDLIVWKLVLDLIVGMMELSFKIDLIVWKY